MFDRSLINLQSTKMDQSSFFKDYQPVSYHCKRVFQTSQAFTISILVIHIHKVLVSKGATSYICSTYVHTYIRTDVRTLVPGLVTDTPGTYPLTTPFTASTQTTPVWPARPNYSLRLIAMGSWYSRPDLDDA